MADTLLLFELEPVITLGRSARREHLRLSQDEIVARGIALREAGRGGDVTFHGPGQLVGYPVMALTGARRDAHLFLRDIEETLIRTCGDFDVDAFRRPGLTGVWAERGKLGAIGVRFSSRWVTSHGFALNVSADLRGFELIVPCGLHGERVCSLERLLGRSLSLTEVAAVAAGRLAEVFGLRLAGLPSALLS